jgi:hypothetical protein
MNKEIVQIFEEIIKLLEIKGDKALSYKIRAYRNAINILNNLSTQGRPASIGKVDISDIYREKGLKGIRELGIGEKNAKKIEEYIKKQKITEYEELNEETAIQNIIAHFFQSKGLGLQELKENAKKKKIIYSRYTKPAKQLLELAGSIEKAKSAIDTVANWANSRKLDYTIETVFKKWLELDRLKPKEIVKKPFYKGDPMIWSETKKKWFVIKNSEWLEYVGKKEEIEWRIVQ